MERESRDGGRKCDNDKELLKGRRVSMGPPPRPPPKPTRKAQMGPPPAVKRKDVAPEPSRANVGGAVPPKPNRRLSLPTSTMGLTESFRRAKRRASLKLAQWMEEPSESETSQTCLLNDSADPFGAASKKIEVVDGVVTVQDQYEVRCVAWDEEKVTHLIYGEGYDGKPNNEGQPDELLFILEKTPDLEVLELRGFWNFAYLSRDLLSTFPRFKLKTLVMPKEGRHLDLMGSFLVGVFGKSLVDLTCSAAFLEGNCLRDVSLLTPKLKKLTIHDSTPEAVESIVEDSKTVWILDSLNLNGTQRLVLDGDMMSPGKYAGKMGIATQLRQINSVIDSPDF